MKQISPEERLLTAVKRAEQATQLAKDGAVARAGLTKAQYNALLILSSAPGLTGAELARRCFVTPQAMNETVGRLERDGFIHRRRHETHRHVLEVTLSESGHAALEAADREVVALELELRSVLSAAEQRTLAELLARVEAAGTDVVTARTA